MEPRKDNYHRIIKQSLFFVKYYQLADYESNRVLLDPVTFIRYSIIICCEKRALGAKKRRGENPVYLLPPPKPPPKEPPPPPPEKCPPPPKLRPLPEEECAAFSAIALRMAEAEMSWETLIRL